MTQCAFSFEMAIWSGVCRERRGKQRQQLADGDWVQGRRGMQECMPLPLPLPSPPYLIVKVSPIELGIVANQDDGTIHKVMAGTVMQRRPCIAITTISIGAVEEKQFDYGSVLVLRGRHAISRCNDRK